MFRMRMILVASIVLVGVVTAHAEQTCNDFKKRLDAAMRAVKLDVA